MLLRESRLDKDKICCRQTELSQLDGNSSLQALNGRSRILPGQHHLRSNRGQPEGLQLRVQQKTSAANFIIEAATAESRT
jgi:hypothetical protein